MESLTFTKQADGWYSGSMTTGGEVTIVQVEREFVDGGNNLVVLASMGGLPQAVYKVLDGMADANLLLEIDLPEGTSITVRSITEVRNAFYGSVDMLIEKNITANGTYNASDDNALGYSKITVNAEGELIEKIVYNDGTYVAEDDGADGYSQVTVDTSSQLTTKTITADGTYYASSDNKRGYSQVTVDTSSQLTTKTITANGTYNAQDDGKKGYSQVVVNVPAPPIDNTDYPYFEAAQENSSIRFNNLGTNNSTTKPVVYWSRDKVNWNLWDKMYNSVILHNVGDRVWLKGENNKFSRSILDYSQFIMSGSVKAGGNIMYLINATNPVIDDYSFYHLFYDCSSLLSAPTLPATTLANSCYSGMFANCRSLTSVPTLPATTLANSCYSSMFQSCTSLTSAPTLPAMTLANNCYQYMFRGCRSLTSAPTLPATTLADSCYYSMFQGCTSLTSVPTLPAMTLANNCYQYMFQDCTSLTVAPTLPATTLANSCYYSMFQGCTSLVNVPELPATALVYACYGSIFKGCTSLNKVTLPNISTWSTSASENWLYGVAASGSVYCLNTNTIPENSVDGIPTGWTRVDI